MRKDPDGAKCGHWAMPVWRDTGGRSGRRSASGRAGVVLCLLVFATLTGGVGRPAVGQTGGRQAFHLASERVGTPRTWVFGLAERGGEVWAVGSFGINVRRPGTATWMNIVAPEPGRLPLAITFTPAGAGVAVGQDGAVWEVAPGAEQWVSSSVGSSDRLFSVAVTPGGVVIAVGAFGAIYDRPAGTTTWRRVPTPWEEFDGPHLYGVLPLDEHTALVVGEHATVLKVRDGAITDRQQFGEESLFAITRCGADYVAAGQEGAVLTSADGAAWKASRVAQGFDVYGLGCLADQRVVALSTGTVQIGSPAGGWQRFEPNSTRPAWFSSVLVSGSTVLLGGQGDIWRADLSPRNG